MLNIYACTHMEGYMQYNIGTFFLDNIFLKRFVNIQTSGHHFFYINLAYCQVDCLHYMVIGYKL